MQAKTYYVVLVKCNGRCYADVARVPRQFKYDLLRRAARNALHPLYKPLQRYGREAFTFHRYPVNFRNRLSLLEQIRADYNCYEPRGYNALPYKEHARTAVKLRARDNFKELYESYLAAGETPAMAETRARMAMVAEGK